MPNDAPYSEMRLPFCEAARGKPIRIEYSLMFRLLNYARSGRATLGGLGSDQHPQEPNRSTESKRGTDGLGTLLQDLIPDGALRIHLEGSQTPSTIRAIEKGDHWRVEVAE